MSVIGFLTVILSVLAMLACTRVLGRAAALATHPGGVRLYLPHAVWTVIALAWPIRFLWGLWQLSAAVLLPRFFAFPLFAMLVGAGLSLYLMAEAVLPRRPSDAGPADLREHYFRAYRVLFAGAAAYRLVSWVANVWVMRPPVLALSNLLSAAVVVLLLAGALSRNPRLHGLLALLGAAVTVVGFARLVVG